MSEAKHTPAPIGVCSPGDYGDYKGRCIVLIGDDRRIAIVLGVDEEAKANAALFAAAPELLAAARFIQDHICDPERGPRDLYPAFGLHASRAVDLVNAAIAKAEGRA